jgi:Tfp pilus assembly protein PilF
MKRIALGIILILGISAGYSQSSKVVSAFNYMKPQYNELDKAKASIDQAAVHPKTAGQAKTWYYRGQVYHKLYQSSEEKFKNLDDNPLMVAANSFIKAVKLDTKKRYEDKLLFEIKRSANLLFNKGSGEYEQKKFVESLQSFEKVIEIGALPYINQVDTGAFFNAAIAADQAGMYDEAIKYYEISAEYGYEGSKVYKYIADLYFTKGDTVAALNTFKKGIDAYPEDNVNLYIQLVNFYLGKEDLDQAYVFIEKALEKDSENASLWYVYGIAGETKDPDSALAAFVKATEINPEYWEAMYMAGKIHYDRGYNANKLAQEIPLDDAEGYKAAVALTDEHFKKALPFFESAIAIEGDDAQTLNALKELYYRFKENDKLAAINKKIEELR